MVAQHLTWLHPLVGSMIIALPSATGANPSCPLEAFPLYAPLTPSTLPCILFHGVWGAGYLILWIIATFLAIRPVLKYRYYFFTQKTSFEEKQYLICPFTQLILFVNTHLTVRTP